MTARFETIAQYPAFDVIKMLDENNVVYDGDILTDSSHLESWTLGSVAGYALENNMDPTEALERAVKHGHETHYAMSLGASLTDNPNRKLPRRIEIKMGDVITFHGKRFKIEAAPNHNIKLIEQ